RTLLPDLTLGAALEFARNDAERRSAKRLYGWADVVVSAPGGFFHDFYAIEPRLQGLEHALALDKPVILAGQSIGPFWKAESIARVREVFNRLAAICVRDDISRDVLDRCGVEPSRIVDGTDLAFLWRRLSPELFRARSSDVRHVGLCLRVWPLKDDASATETARKGAKLIEHLLVDPARRVTMISTCQGVPGYWDDSMLHDRVMRLLPDALRSRVVVDRARRAPEGLIRKLGSLDALVSMRLHGCLLAMLGGTPAAGLAYEQKTPQLYQQCGLDDLQIPFDAPIEQWIALVDRLLASVDTVHRGLPEMLETLSLQAQRTIEVITGSVACLSR
ncbi:MAG TPA: polysaccharide pyruvyl transferase family protein, partial [Tepidisphaeraceae bacterium]|nr:polysaccharide pyruvyl transferase family protein [Tepidisphaeraceae bacterium]